MKSILKSEPALLLAAAALVLVLGIDLFEVGETVKALVEVGAIVGFSGFGTRSRVYSPQTVENLRSTLSATNDE